MTEKMIGGPYDQMDIEFEGPPPPAVVMPYPAQEEPETFCRYLPGDDGYNFASVMTKRAAGEYVQTMRRRAD